MDRINGNAAPNQPPFVATCTPTGALNYFAEKRASASIILASSTGKVAGQQLRGVFSMNAAWGRGPLEIDVYGVPHITTGYKAGAAIHKLGAARVGVSLLLVRPKELPPAHPLVDDGNGGKTYASNCPRAFVLTCGLLVIPIHDLPLIELAPEFTISNTQAKSAIGVETAWREYCVHVWGVDPQLSVVDSWDGMKGAPLGSVDPALVNDQREPNNEQE